MKVAQYRYFQRNPNNPPSNVQAKDLYGNEENKTVFSGKNIVQLGIQGPTGLHFTLNGNVEHEMMIGSSGMYELDVNGFTVITDLRFEKAGIEDEHCHLIVDIVYQEGGELSE